MAYLLTSDPDYVPKRFNLAQNTVYQPDKAVQQRKKPLLASKNTVQLQPKMQQDSTNDETDDATEDVTHVSADIITDDLIDENEIINDVIIEKEVAEYINNEVIEEAEVMSLESELEHEGYQAEVRASGAEPCGYALLVSLGLLVLGILK